MNKAMILNEGHILTSISEKKPGGLFLYGQFGFGDADGESTESFKLDTLEELYAILRYLEWIDKMPYNAEIEYRSRTKSDIKEDDFYKIAGENFRESYLWDGVTDWWEYDHIFSCQARLERYWVIFCDDSGEWNVTISQSKIHPGENHEQ